jgi:2,4-dienoyl-CoA reductase
MFNFKVISSDFPRRFLFRLRAQNQPTQRFLSSFRLGDISAPMLQKGTFSGGYVALVTGGGSGLGRSIAETLANLGATVAIAGRRQAVVESTAKEINESMSITSLPSSIRGRIIPFSCDVRDEESVAKVFEQIENATMQKVNLLVNNAAGNFISPTERLNVKSFKTIIDSVLIGTVNVTLHAAKRAISDKDNGKKIFHGLSIVNILATYAPNGSAYVIPSAVSKSGVYALTKSLAAEWGAKYSIRVNAVSPGPIKTEGAFSRLDPTGRFEKLLLQRIPAKRLGEKEELANVVSFLLSPYSSWMTGQCLLIDGGDSLIENGMFNALATVSEKEWDDMRRIVSSKVDKK